MSRAIDGENEMTLLKNRQMQLSIAALLCLVLSWVPGFRNSVYLSIAFGSFQAVPAAWQTLRAKKLDVEFLMILAAIGAIALGEPVEAAILLFLFALSKGLEDLTMSKTKSAIDGLMQLRPSRATVVREGIQLEIPVEEIVVGDEVLLPPFMTAAVDGIISSGIGPVDTAAMTGESNPVTVRPGDPIISGVRNLEFALQFQATSTISNSTLQKVVTLVAQAQENQGSGERISRWFGERYTWFVLIVSLVALVFRLLMLATPLREAVYASLTLLVALSPCALVISVPAATLSAMTWAARHGILIRGGDAIERMGTIDTFALDKTGTITSGRPELVEVCLCEIGCSGAEVCWNGLGDFSPEALEVLQFAAAAEAQSEHPVGHAIRRAIPSGVSVPVAEALEVVPGLGIRAQVNGIRVLIGQLSLLIDAGVKPDEEFKAHIAKIQAQGFTVACMAMGSRLAALGFKDAPKPQASQSIASLKQLGIRNVVMLTGDHPTTAETISKEVGIAEVLAGLLPADKLEQILRLQKLGNVAMVGDGVNDAPALTAAHVGIAMGGLGSDIALNAADIVLINDRIEALPELVKLGRKTNGVIRANLVVGGLVISGLTIGSLAGILPLPVAVIGHEGSTLLVILNGLRLLRGVR